jgi:hypothetical protein
MGCLPADAALALSSSRAALSILARAKNADLSSCVRRPLILTCRLLEFPLKLDENIIGGGELRFMQQL